MALSKTTQDHEEIKAWAEERGGKPAEVASTEGKDGPGILRLEFPGAVHAQDSNLKEIGWEEFFEKFDRSGLALVYQDETAEGERSNFNRLIYPENTSGSTSSKQATKSRPSAKKAPAKKSIAGQSGAKGMPKKALATKKGAPAKKGVATKRLVPAAKKSTTVAKNAPAVKSGAAKSSAKKASAKKVVAKAPAKKTAAKEASTKKTAPKKALAKKRR